MIATMTDALGRPGSVLAAASFGDRRTHGHTDELVAEVLAAVQFSD
jgi:hypothetical protein